MALGVGAGVALAVLALLIPAMLVWQCRKQSPSWAGYRVAGGTPALALVFHLRHSRDWRPVFDRTSPARSSASKDYRARTPSVLDNHHAMAVYEPLMQAALLKFLPPRMGCAIVTPHLTLCFIGICSGVVRCAIHRACSSSAAIRHTNAWPNAFRSFYPTAQSFLPCRKAIASSAAASVSGKLPDQPDSDTRACNQSVILRPSTMAINFAGQTAALKPPG